MKKLKYSLIIAVGFILFPLQTFAASRNAVAWVNENGSIDSDIVYDNGKHYQDYRIKVNYNGGTYDAYCADFDRRMGGGNNPAKMTCEEIESKALAYVLNDPNASHKVKQIAARILAQEIGIALSNHTVISSNQTMDEVNQLIERAKSVGNESLTFLRVSASESTVTYSVSSPVEIENINFTCDDCNIESNTWNGTSGTLTVSAKTGNCSFTIHASYSGTLSQQANNAKVIYCTGDAGVQGVTFTIKGRDFSNQSTSSSAEFGPITQSYSDSIEKNSGGNYYQQYCDDTPNIPLKCTEKTTVTVPSYCDDANDEQITIESPKNVQYCILNNKDEAGNTYKMDDGQISKSNPYCAVYCKEDYKMTMPGAQYTDSGRYFNLKNTKVEATRTCYTTNPDGNSDEPQININKFITDIVAKQKELLKAKDEYQKAKREKELASQAKGTKAYACGNEVGTNYSIGSESYEGFEYSNINCNETTTGICNIRTTTRSTSSYSWGTYGDSNWNNTQCTPSISTTNVDFDANLRNALNNMTRIQNELKEMTGWMEECYNWANNLCIDTDVDFDYNEQYSTNINFELVNGGGTFQGKEATYSSNRNIDKEYTANEMGVLENPGYVYCDASTCNYSNIANQISTLRTHYYYRKIETNGFAEYANTQSFQTNLPHGTIDTVEDPNAIRYNYNYLGTVFPVALNTPTGVYKWTLNFSNVGQYNDFNGCKGGRLDEVVKAVGSNTSAGIEYVCVYVVDCPDCDYECVGEGCVIPDPEPKCPDCDVYCVNCLFDGDEATYFYRVIGSDLNPNNRELGANLTTEKGQRTIEEIEKNGETIYVEAEYRFVMDAGDMKRIRDYNKETGTYVAEDLTYHDLGGFTNIYGTSNFIENGLKNGFFSEVKRNTVWTLWPGEIGNNVGPSWK